MNLMTVKQWEEFALGNFGTCNRSKVKVPRRTVDRYKTLLLQFQEEARKKVPVADEKTLPIRFNC